MDTFIMEGGQKLQQLVDIELGRACLAHLQTVQHTINLVRERDAGRRQAVSYTHLTLPTKA